MKRVNKITVIREVDTDYDPTLTMGKFSEEKAAKFAIKHSDKSGEYKYFNADNVSNMKEARENYKRVMQFERGERVAFGIYASAEIATSSDGETWHLNTIRTAGIWGVDVDDTDDPYLTELAFEEMFELRATLRSLDFLDEVIYDAPVVSPDIALPERPMEFERERGIMPESVEAE